MIAVGLGSIGAALALLSLLSRQHPGQSHLFRHDDYSHAVGPFVGGYNTAPLLCFKKPDLMRILKDYFV